MASSNPCQEKATVMAAEWWRPSLAEWRTKCIADRKRIMVPSNRSPKLLMNTCTTTTTKGSNPKQNGCLPLYTGKHPCAWIRTANKSVQDSGYISYDDLSSFFCTVKNDIYADIFVSLICRLTRWMIFFSSSFLQCLYTWIPMTAGHWSGIAKL